LKRMNLREASKNKRRGKPAQDAGQVPKPPKYCGPHSPSGKAYCWVDGKQKYLPGQFGSPESVAAYRRLLASLTGKRAMPDSDQCTVAELFDFWFGEHEGKIPNKKYSHYCQCAVAILDAGHAGSLASDFGPRKLIEVRDLLIEKGLARSTINQRIGRIKKVFKWGVSREMVPPNVMLALYSLDGLGDGSLAAPPRSIKPVDFSRVDDLRGILSDTVYDMLRVLWLTGMRPDNLCSITMSQVKKESGVWLYTPSQHKTKYKGKGLVVTLGPRTQEIIRRCTGGRPDTEFIFRPEDSVAWHRIHNPKFIPWSTRNLSPRFTPNTLRQAVLRAQAHKAGIQVGRKLPTKKDFGIAGWDYFTVYQLRHAAATELRQAFPIEQVRAYLGHSTLDATQIYTEHDLASAKQIALLRG